MNRNCSGGEEDPIAAQLRALGATCRRLLSQGKEVPDEVCARLVVHAIEGLPRDSAGFVLADYPATFSAVRILEKLLTGFDDSLPPPHISTVAPPSVMPPNPKGAREREP